MPDFDLLAFGLNALDHLISIERFPARGEKIPYRSVRHLPGGQAAVAALVCRRYGFAVSYAGSVGDDDVAALHIADFEAAGIDLSQLRRVPGVASQQSWILVEQASGERTIAFERDPALEYPPAAVAPDWIASGRVLLVDGHDAEAAARAAALARAVGVTVVADLSNVHEDRRTHTERLLHNVDELVASASFAPRLDPTLAALSPPDVLDVLRRRFDLRVAAMTLGAAGALALDDAGLHAQPAFTVPVVDTTGAGDVFHGGYIVGMLHGWPLPRRLEFACALAALNCTAWGARGHIAAPLEVDRLVAASSPPGR